MGEFVAVEHRSDRGVQDQDDQEKLDGAEDGPFLLSDDKESAGGKQAYPDGGEAFDAACDQEPGEQHDDTGKEECLAEDQVFRREDDQECGECRDDAEPKGEITQGKGVGDDVDDGHHQCDQAKDEREYDHLELVAGLVMHEPFFQMIRG